MNEKRRICTLADVRLYLSDSESLEVYKVDSYGAEKGPPTYTDTRPGEPEAWRLYHCNNCGTQMDGEDSFSMKSHLGKFHELVDPFHFKED